MTLKTLSFYCVLVVLNAFVLMGIVTSAGLARIMQWSKHVVAIIKLVDIVITMLTVSLDFVTGLHLASVYLRYREHAYK